MSNHFANMYDALTYDVPDNLWIDIISPYLEGKQSVLDIGCGTGRILSALDVKEKYGFDASEEMISIAKDNDSSLELSVQTMESFNYERTFDVITANSDVINYLDDLNEVSLLIERVTKHLEPEGIFIFDSHSVNKMMIEFNDQTYADDLETISYIWFARRGESPYSVDHELIFFNQTENGTYDKTIETFSQRTYPHETLVEMINKSKLKLIHSFSDFDSGNRVKTECDRIFYILQKS